MEQLFTMGCPSFLDSGQVGPISRSWLTMAGMGRGKSAAVYRLWSSLTVTIIYSLILGIILVICNVDPASGYIYGAGYSWKDLEIVKNPYFLNLLLVITICLGWVSFLVDIILAWCKNHNWRSHNWGPLNKAVEWFVDPQETQDKASGFWDEAVLLQGLGVKLIRN